MYIVISLFDGFALYHRWLFGDQIFLSLLTFVNFYSLPGLLKPFKSNNYISSVVREDFHTQRNPVIPTTLWYCDWRPCNSIYKDIQTNRFNIPS